MTVSALVDLSLKGTELGEVIELFVERDQALRALRDVLADEPGPVDRMSIVELGPIGLLKRPAELGPTRQPQERRVYRIRVTFDSLPPSATSPGRKLGYKIEENDNDIHLAVRDRAGHTMIVDHHDEH